MILSHYEKGFIPFEIAQPLVTARKMFANLSNIHLIFCIRQPDAEINYARESKAYSKYL
jgi:hypothetical protein